MAPRSAGRTSNPNKPGYFNTAFEQTNDHHQYHEEEFSTVDTGIPDTTAKLRYRVLDMAQKVMKGEERSVVFGELLKMGMGTKEVENFVRGQCGLRMTMSGSEVGDEAKVMFENEREFVRNAMENKLITK